MFFQSTKADAIITMNTAYIILSSADFVITSPVVSIASTIGFGASIVVTVSAAGTISGFKKSDFVYGNVVENLVDLFSLSYTNFLVKVPTSTWSIFAENYTNKESVFVTDDWEETIKEKYIKTLNII